MRKSVGAEKAIILVQIICIGQIYAAIELIKNRQILSALVKDVRP